MKLDLALQVLEKEYVKNKTFELNQVSDKLQFLLALTVVEQGLNCGHLSETEYIKKVIKVLE